MNAPEALPLRQAQELPAVTDDPRYIGAAVSRPGARRLVEGRGCYVDDITLPRMAHVVYWRSPVAHCRILAIHREDAAKMPGVLAIVDGAQVAALCKPWVATLGHLAGMKSAPQHALAIDRACWQGEPVVAVLAETRVQAEDALQYLTVDWEDLPAATEMETALAATLDWKTVQIAADEKSVQAYAHAKLIWEEGAGANYAPMLRRWLQMQISLALYPYAGLGASLSERITIIGVRLATIKIALLSNCSIKGALLSPDVVVRIVQSLSRFLDHLSDPAFSLSIYTETGWTREERMRGLLQ